MAKVLKNQTAFMILMNEKPAPRMLLIIVRAAGMECFINL